MSGRRVWFSFSLLTLFMGVSPFVVADETMHKLAYKFKAGDFYYYDVDDQAEMTTQYGNNQSKLRQHTQVLKFFRIIAVDENGGATIEPIMETVKMASQSADKQVVIYDSTKPDDPPKEFEKIASAINRPQARFQITANGRLTKVIMLDADLPKSFTDLAAKADPSINPLVALPEQSVKVGDKWSEKFETPITVGTGLNRLVTLIRSFELSKVDNNLATIRVRTSLVTPTSDPEVLRQLVQQTPTGTIEFDMKQGRIINRSFTIEEKIVGAFGDQSLLQATGATTERLVDPRLPRVVGNAPAPLPK